MSKFDAELFERYVHKVYALCRKYTTDISTAKDYMQECFLHIHDHFHKYDEEKGSLDGWIFRVSTNVILKEIKKAKKMSFDFLSDNHSEIYEDTENENIDPRELTTALDQLPQGYKQVITMYVLENKSHKEIAQALNITESSSRSQLTRAKIYLKKLINKSEYGRI